MDKKQQTFNNIYVRGYNMPRIKKQMTYKGFDISESCMRCGYLNPAFNNDRFRCCTKDCPTHLPQTDKDYILNNWNPVEVLEPTFEELIKEQEKRNKLRLGETKLAKWLW